MKTGFAWTSAALVASVAGALTLGACAKKSETAEPSAAAAGGEPALVISDQTEWDGLVASGQASFDRTCGSCHPGGEADLGPKLKGHKESMAHMTKQVREGSGRMKPVGPDRLPDEEMKGLMVYLASISAVGDVKGP
jgi:mono/diheme cytochrome c family protein